MFSEKATGYLLKALNEEIVNAEKWGKTYASMHEAYAVLKEELEEASEDLKDASTSFNDFWDTIRMGEYEICMEECVCNIKESCYLAVKELIQVMAVCHKIQKTLKKKD